VAKERASTMSGSWERQTSESGEGVEGSRRRGEVGEDEVV
jgi:hypothetical protein